MHLWRISNHANLSGLGAAVAAGRWHSSGEDKRAVYLAEHAAVALIENLVNLSSAPQFFPSHFQLIKVAIPDSISAAELTPAEIASVDPEDTVATQAIGDAWLASASSVLLKVPSVPSPESWNYLFNPLHPEAGSARVEWARPIAYDKRLFRLGI